MMSRVLIVFVASLLQIHFLLASENEIRLQEKFDEKVIGLQLEILEDPEALVTFEDVVSGSMNGRFFPSRKLNNGFGFTDTAYWFRFTVTSESTKPVTWFLRVGYELLDHVRFYSPAGNGKYDSCTAGLQHKKSNCTANYRTPLFSHTQVPGTKTFYLWVKSTSAMNVPLSILSESAYEKKKEFEALILWLFYGLMLGLFIYNLFLLFTVRDTSYLYYLVFIFSFSVFLFIHNGLAYLYFWHDSPGTTPYVSFIFISLACVSMVQFTRSFLHTKRNTPMFDKVHKATLVISCLMLLGALIDYYPMLLKLGAFYALFLISSLFITGIQAWRKGYGPSRYYVFAWSIMILSMLAGLLKALGVFPIHFITDWGFQIGVALEAVLLSLALADRINAMKTELEQLNVTLEEKVRQRTVQIQSQNEQLIKEIDERKAVEERRSELEQQLIHSQKMEAIGRMASGIAHDMNNVLTIVMAYASQLVDDIKKEDANWKKVNSILSASLRARDIMKKLIGFARRGKYRKDKVDMNESVNKVVGLLESSASKMVEIQVEQTEPMFYIEGDHDQLENVILNIGLNAVDAMPEGGALTLTTKVLDMVIPMKTLDTKLEPGKYVLVEVTDTGQGMDEETKKKIFDPFFSTRGPSKGSGLGMSMAHGVVLNHGGAIHVDSELNEGTRVSCYFPAKEQVREKVQEVKKESPVETRSEATILIVDDEDMIRETCEMYLDSHGFKTIHAENGKEAVEIYSEKKNDIDIVVLDMLMPIMDGEEAFEKMKEINPDVKVIIISGYVDQEKTKNMLSAGARDFINKPFEMKVLKSSISSALSS